MTMGYSVPSSTAAVATTSNTLLLSRTDSRETHAIFAPRLTEPARQANKVSELPTTTARKIRMKTPRVGSEAKA